jgi:hypothetical protein
MPLAEEVFNYNLDRVKAMRQYASQLDALKDAAFREYLDRQAKASAAGAFNTPRS